MSLKDHLGQLRDFLTTLSAHKGDVSNITAPPFVLSTRSATELPSSWASHHTLFLEQGASDRPELRALAVLKNFLCALKSQQYTGRTEAEGIKKPINAFLGELFIAEFRDGEGSTRLISEQVSHHPPVTACCLYNAAAGISAEGYVGQKVTFSMTSGVTIQQIGHAIIHIDKYGEDHLMTLPTLHVKGVLTGTPYPELDGTCYITSTSDFTSEISFRGKGALGTGKKNRVEAALTSNKEPNKPLFEVSGAWNDTLTIRDCTADKILETIDVNALQTSELVTAPPEEQDAWESRRAWGPTIEGIQAQKLKQVSAAKSQIEEAQRAMRKVEEENGVTWPRLFFRRTERHDLFEKLAGQVRQPLNVEHTDGIWRFVGFEAAEALREKKPYHRGLTPSGQA